MSFEQTLDGVRKRTADLAALDNLHHPRPKRPRIKPPFIIDEYEDIEAPIIAAAQDDMKIWWPSNNYALTSGTEEVNKMPSSPDYGPTCSPPSVAGDCQDYVLGDFAVHKEERKQDEHQLQIAEEAIFNAIAMYKSLNGEKLSLNVFTMLQREVNSSIYNKVPRRFSGDVATITADSNGSTQVNPPTPSTTAADTTSSYSDASIQADLPDMSTAATSNESIYINAGIQANPPTTSTTATNTESFYRNAGIQVNPPTTSTTATNTESFYRNAGIQVNPPTTSTTATNTVSFYRNAGVQVTPPTTPAAPEPDWTSIYKTELELVRMQRPFITGKGVITVQTKLRSNPKRAKPASSHRVHRHASANTHSSSRTKGVSYNTSHMTSVPKDFITDFINLDDSDDDKSAQTANNKSLRVGGAPKRKAPAGKFAASFEAVEHGMQPKVPIQHPSVPASQSSTHLDESTASFGYEGSEGRQAMSLDDSDNEAFSSVTKHSFLHNEVASDSPGVNRAHFPNDHNSGHDDSGIFMTSPNNKLPNSIIGLEDDENYDDDGSRPFTLADDPKFYGMTGKEPQNQIASMLRFQDRTTSHGHIPAPNVGHRLELQTFFNAVGTKHVRDPEREIRGHLDRAWGTRYTPDEETAISENWCSEPSSFELYKGFPLVEDVVFIVPRNCTKPDGDCYWRTISYSLYGTDTYWDIVKAKHLAYVHHVLKNPGHARHQLYSEQLNKKFFKSSSTSHDGRTISGFSANMWQVLHMAHAWTPSLMQQVTADLYNICVICFTREGRGPNSWTITETAMRGSYNSRHIFLQFIDGNHFQPMCPNEYRPSEFRYPRITVDRTAKYSNAPKATSSKSSLQHPWRNDFTKDVPSPVARLHGCDIESLRKWMGSE